VDVGVAGPGRLNPARRHLMSVDYGLHCYHDELSFAVMPVERQFYGAPLRSNCAA
jgi:hypothetical protein